MLLLLLFEVSDENQPHGFGPVGVEAGLKCLHGQKLLINMWGLWLGI